ncbi:hypothetical protein [Pyruvatibacter mobilis]|uniref:hypothetical protein n=1 Tax=Pyruvatibacter mobilis TaxID=1712261 RepID=UPI003D1156C7
MRTDPHFIKQILLAVTLAVLAAGFAREAFVLEIGTHTVLQDLRQFHLDSENSVPAWWSSSLMLVAAMVLYRLGAEAKAAGDRMWQLWALLAVAFFFLSMDEAASFHEGVIEPLKSVFGFGGIFFYAWVVPAVLCLGGFGLLILPLLRQLPPRLSGRLVLSGIIFVGGALGMEMVGGWLDYSGLRASTFYVLAVTVEETAEFVGLLLFNFALLDQFDLARAQIGHRARGVASPTGGDTRAAAAPAMAGTGQYPVAAE